jgi:K(+)-stimulated pyrophosphate-energized sodium pump
VGIREFMVAVAIIVSFLIQFFSIFTLYRLFRTRSYDITGKISEISSLIKSGSLAYLNREFLLVSVVSIILAVAISLFFGLLTALTFSLGSVFSALSAYLGTLIAVNTNSKTACSARESFQSAFTTAFSGGAVAGFLLTSIGLLVVSGLYALFLSLGYSDPSNLVGLGFGASLTGLFARVGGGIYTKAADISADIVGKVEMGFSEDDPRNPAVIADQVGDNVGDIAGTGSDVFQSYVCSLIAAMIIGALTYGKEGTTYPLLVLSAGLISSLIGSLLTKIGGGNVRKAKRSIYLGMYTASFFTAASSEILAYWIFKDLKVFYSVLAGIVAILLLAHITEYYTSPGSKVVRGIVTASKSGPAINILTGLSVGLEATLAPTLILSLATLIAYWFEGLYGVTLISVGFLSIMATFISMSAYGPIVDNANGLIAMSKMNGDLRRTMDMLDSIGNMTKATCKVYAVGTSVLAQIALFSAYLRAAHLNTINVANPLTVAGLLIGGSLSFLLCSLVIRAVSKAAHVMIREIRREVSEGKIEGARRAHIHCIEISTKAALKGMFYPAILSVTTPFIIGLLFGSEALGGLIAGNLATTLPLSLLMCISGAAWDNAKKHIEVSGEKGSPLHVALIIGDTVGDPLKDASGPSLDIFINLIGIASLLYAAHTL